MRGFEIFKRAADVLGKGGGVNDDDVCVVQEALNVHQQAREKYAAKLIRGIMPQEIVLLRIGIREALEHAGLESLADLQAIQRKMQKCDALLQRWIAEKGSLPDAEKRPLRWVIPYLDNLGSQAVHDDAPYRPPQSIDDIYAADG